MKGNILIVEPEFIVAADLGMIVRKAGYAVSGVASSAEGALKLLASNEPTLVLTDTKLYGKTTGIDLGVRLNELGIPFIYISGNFAPKAVEEALATNPCGFIEKPFRENDVLKALSKLLLPGMANSNELDPCLLNRLMCGG
jgi:DNA-binding NtrC family response regulator